MHLFVLYKKEIDTGGSACIVQLIIYYVHTSKKPARERELLSNQAKKVALKR